MGGRRGLPLRPLRRQATASTPSTRRRPPSAGRCTSGTCFPTPTPTSSRATSACAAAPCSIRWAGTTTACRPSGASRTTTACAAIRRCRTTRRSRAPATPAKQPIAISRPNFVELCATLTAEDEKAFERVWRHLGSVGRLGPDLRDDRPPGAPRVAARVSPSARARRGVPAGGADAVGRGFPHRGRPGRARRSGNARRVSIACGFALRQSRRSGRRMSKSRRRGRN